MKQGSFGDSYAVPKKLGDDGIRGGFSACVKRI